MKCIFLCAVVSTILASVFAISINEMNGVLIIDFGSRYVNRIILKNLPGINGAFEFKDGVLEQLSAADEYEIAQQQYQLQQGMADSHAAIANAMANLREVFGGSRGYHRNRQFSMQRNAQYSPV